VSHEAAGRAAVLPGHRLLFNKKSTDDKSGKANIAAHAGSDVWGVLYAVPDGDLIALRPLPMQMSAGIEKSGHWPVMPSRSLDRPASGEQARKKSYSLTIRRRSPDSL